MQGVGTKERSRRSSYTYKKIRLKNTKKEYNNEDAGTTCSDNTKENCEVKSDI